MIGAYFILVNRFYLKIAFTLIERPDLSPSWSLQYEAFTKFDYIGSCGAVASGTLAIGLALGLRLETTDESLFRQSCATVRDALLDRYDQKYDSLLCKDIQRRFYGKAWDLTRDEMSVEFLGITQGCVITEGATWATEVILDEFEKGNVKGYVGSPEIIT